MEVFGQSAIIADVNAVMKKVYLKMTLALIITAVVAYYCATSMTMLSILYSNPYSFLVLFLVEIGIVIGISAAINKISSAVATLLFILYSVVNGATMSAILLAYTAESVHQTFFITAGVFGAMTIYGYVTKSDLSRMGSILYMALFGLIITCVVNIFLKSDTLGWIISLAGVAIFIGLTAWDTQKIKQMAMMAPYESGKVSTIGALTLYLDFVNLFIYLLRIFGNRR